MTTKTDPNHTKRAPETSGETAHDILRAFERPLDPIFSPKIVAVIGATERKRSVGRTVMSNLVEGGFPGKIYPVNPIQDAVLGLKAYPSVSNLPEKPDLAVIITPPKTVPGIVKECVSAGVRGAIIISAGFKEVGAAGVELEQQVLTEARRGNIRIVGPNCLGVMSPRAGFNATFAAGMARPGSVALVSQSGALCTAILDWSLREKVGFSAFVSLGSMLDVGWGDLIYHLGDDPNTRSIVIYMETIGDARSFLSAAREVALTKPIIVIKPGRTAAAAKAAASHTGSLTGSDEVLQAAFQRAGVLRVDTISELFDMAEVLAKQPRPKGPRLTIVTNAGGPGVLATDALVTSGAQLADLTPETMAALNQILPPTWSHNNPVDLIGDAGPELYARAVDITAKDPHTDGLLVILTPQAMTDPTATAEELKPFSHLQNKPIIASWMGAGEVEKGEDILNEARIPTFKYPDRAARAFQYMWRYSQNLKALYETPALVSEQPNAGRARAHVEALIQNARQSTRTLLTEFESKQLLAAYGIPVVETRIAHTEEEAVQHAEKIGYPVVLKLFSETITHKTEVGGVQLNVRTEGGVRKAWNEIKKGVEAIHVGELSNASSDLPLPATQERGEGRGEGLPSSQISKGSSSPRPSPPSDGGEGVGHRPHFLGVTVQPMISLQGYELILGSSLDLQFGPVLLFGTGGQLVEVFKDRALGLPPLNATLARRMIEQTKIHTALQGVRGRPPVNLPALEELLVRFSQLVVEQKWIAEIDINPLLASPDGLLALDARVVLHGLEVTEQKLPKPAIRPYPTQYVALWKLKDGTPVTIRPIRPDDEPLIVRFHETLSEESVYHRYFSQLKIDQRIAHERLTRICFNDYDREIALVVEHQEPHNGSRAIWGVGRLSKSRSHNEAEFALLISDARQRQGLGSELLQRLIQIGRDEKLDRITAVILGDNHAMLHLSRAAGFKVQPDPDHHDFRAEYVF